MLYVAITTFVHIKNFFDFLLDLLFKQILTPLHITRSILSHEFLLWKISKYITYLEIVPPSYFAEEVNGHFLSTFLDRKDIKQNFIQCFLEEFDLVINVLIFCLHCKHLCWISKELCFGNFLCDRIDIE